MTWKFIKEGQQPKPKELQEISAIGQKRGEVIWAIERCAFALGHNKTDNVCKKLKLQKKEKKNKKYQESFPFHWLSVM